MPSTKASRSRNNRRPHGRASHPDEALRARMDELISIERTKIGTSLLIVADVPRLKLKKDKVYTFARFGLVDNIQGSAAVSTGYAVSLSLSSLPSSTEFVNLFEQWRIAQIIVRFVPTPTASPLGQVFSWIDQDDAAVPTSTTEPYQNETLLISPGNQTFERTFTPMAAIGAYGGSAFTSFAASLPHQWMDNASPGILYYGLKILVPQTATAVNLGVATYTAIVQFRRPV